MINSLELTRRATLLLGAAAFTSFIARNVEAAQDSELSAFGDLKYPPDFEHFDYVNPDAPKGGVFSHVGATRIFNQNLLTFNSLNSFVLRGDAALGMVLTFASSLARAEDEPDALYGLAARAVQISSDGLTYRFLMRPGITSHDGSPLTAHDVAFLLKILKDKGHPIAQQSLRDFVGAGTVVVRFTTQRARDVPLFAASLPIFSRAYYSKRPFEETTLEVPLGSGPYKVGRFEPGRPAGRARVEQFRYPALRILPRSRSCLRRVHGQKLSVPGRIYIADLGDTLRLSCSSGRSRQARCDCRQYAIGRKAGSSTRDGTDSRTSACARPSSSIRFRMDQQEHHVRVL
jgi:ABC-type transport system substrate-binding protein